MFQNKGTQTPPRADSIIDNMRMIIRKKKIKKKLTKMNNKHEQLNN